MNISASRDFKVIKWDGSTRAGSSWEAYLRSVLQNLGLSHIFTNTYGSMSRPDSPYERALNANLPVGDRDGSISPPQPDDSQNIERYEKNQKTVGAEYDKGIGAIKDTITSGVYNIVIAFHKDKLTVPKQKG